MGIERLYADGIEQAYQRGLRSPAPAVDPDFRLGSFVAAGLSGIPRGAMEVLGSVRDLSAASQQQFRESPRGRIVAQEYERRTGVAPADQYQMPSGEGIRRAAEYRLGPDPQTSHVADQVFHGLTRFGTKAVGAVAAGGPVGGAALLGAEETNTIYRDLIARGIDSETALKVAAVQGAISAAGVVLPISGVGMATTTAGKVGATAALVAVGGPGAYVAQETLARDILQRAGYADEAAKHDPADLLGLGISTVLPGLVGGVALRGALRSTKPMPPVRTEAGVRDAVQLTPEEQAASDAYERSAGNLAELRKEIARQKDPAARQVLEAELAKQTEAAARAGQGAVAEVAARSPDLVDAARVKVLQETVQRSLPVEPEAYPRLMEAIDDVAAGRAPQVPDFIPPAEREANFKAWFGDSKVVDPEGRPMVVYHGTGSDFQAFDLSQAAVRGVDRAFYFASSPEYASAYALRQGEKGGSPAVQAVFLSMRDPEVRAFPSQQVMDDWVARVGISDRGLVAKLPGGHVVYATNNPLAVKSAIGNSGRFDPNSASLTDPLPARTDAPTTPQAANPEAAAPARGAGDGTAPAAAEPGRSAADLQAAGRAVTPEQIALRKRAVMLNKLMECLTNG